MVFDMWVPLPKMKYPCGQHICSYLASTILEHDNGVGFAFDMSVDSWKINSKSVRGLKEWIDHTLRVKWGYNRQFENTITDEIVIVFLFRVSNCAMELTIFFSIFS